MRILVMSWRDINNPLAGGAEQVTFEHMRRWAAAGRHVTLFTAAYPGAAPEEVLQGVHIVRRGAPHSVHAAAWRWYRRQHRRPSVIVDEIHGVPFCAGAYAGVPTVGWIYEVARDIWNAMYPPPVAVAGRLVETLTLHWYARRQVAFIADSQSTRQDLVATGVAADHIAVIEPAINCQPLAALPAKEETPTFIFVGRLVRMKGVDHAIRAVASLRERLPTIRLWIIGGGDPMYVAELRGLVDQLHLDGSVRFLGRVDEAEKAQRLQRAHVLLHPSQREGWGMNVIEANANGTPSVAYRVPGLRDSIDDGVTGRLCAPGDWAAMADAAAALIAAPERYRAMQERALARSVRFTWDRAASRSLAILERIAAGMDAAGAMQPPLATVMEECRIATR